MLLHIYSWIISQIYLPSRNNEPLILIKGRYEVIAFKLSRASVHGLSTFISLLIYYLLESLVHWIMKEVNYKDSVSSFDGDVVCGGGNTQKIHKIESSWMLMISQFWMGLSKFSYHCLYWSAHIGLVVIGGVWMFFHYTCILLALAVAEGEWIVIDCINLLCCRGQVSPGKRLSRRSLSATW